MAEFQIVVSIFSALAGIVLGFGLSLSDLLQFHRPRAIVVFAALIFAFWQLHIASALIGKERK